MKILLIEDLTAPAKDIINAFDSPSPHEIVWITGVQSIVNNRSYLGFEGIEGETRDNIDLELRQFKLAFVDSELDGQYDGAQLIGPLRRAGVVCVGISAKPDLNGRMMEEGAHTCLPKHALAEQLKYGLFEIDDVVSTFESANDRDIYTIKTSHRRQAHSWRY